MQRHVLRAEVLKDFEAAQQGAERTCLTNDEIREVTNMALQSTPARTTRKWNMANPGSKLSMRTIARYLEHYRGKYYTTTGSTT